MSVPSTYVPATDVVEHSAARFEAFQGLRHIPNLDGLRGVAIVLVLLHHVPAVAAPWLHRLQEHGKHGVSLFFVVSGFIVTTLLLREYRRHSRVDVGGFLWRRVLRLWPLYYAVLCLEALLVFGFEAYSAENRQLFEDKLLCYALYCSNWLESSGEGPFFVSWSLAAEEQFYLGLALVMLLLPPRGLLWVCVALLGFKLGLLYAVGVDPGALPWRALLSYSEAIVFGVLLALALAHPRGFACCDRMLASRPALLVLASLCAALMLTGALENKSSPLALLLYFMYTLLVASCVLQRSLPLLGRGALPSLGVLSYGVYLLHMPAISAVKRVIDEPLAVLALSMLLVVPLAWLSYRYFEQPIRALHRPR